MMKKLMILFVGTLIVLTAVAGSGCARWWHKYHDAEWITKKVDRSIEKLGLNLTDEQKAKLDAIKGKIAGHAGLRRNSTKNMLDLFKEEAEKDIPSFDRVIETFKESNAQKNKDLGEIADMLNEFYMSLDAVQKKKVADLLRKKAGKCDGWIK